MIQLARRAPSLGLALLATALALLVGACAGDPPTRRVETHLSRKARIFIAYGSDGVHEEIERDPEGTLLLPLLSKAGQEQVERFRIEEPGKPPLHLRLHVLCDPIAAEEDAIEARSTVNQLLLKTPKDRISGPDRELLVLYPEPLALLRNPNRGAWLLPAKGQGVVLVVDPDTPPDTRIVLEGRVQPLKKGLRGYRPIVQERPPGPAHLSVAAAGYVHLETELRVRAGIYTLAAVRLAEERKR